MIWLSFLSHSDSARSTLSMCAGLARLPNKAAGEGDRRPYGLEGVGRELLRHEADQRRAAR